MTSRKQIVAATDTIRAKNLSDSDKVAIQIVEIPKLIRVNTSLELAPLGTTHTKQYFKLVIENQDRIGEWFSWAKNKQDMSKTRKYLKQVELDHKTREGIHMGIFFSGKLVGQLSLTKIDFYHLSLNMSGWIDKNYEGAGYFFKAAETALNYAFIDLGFNRIEVRAVATNERSHNLAVRMLRKEGTLKEAHKNGNKFLDIDVYGFLRSEWLSYLTTKK